MTTTKLYLDTRAVKDGCAPIKVVITKKGRTALLSTGIKVLESQWDKQRQIVTSADNAKKLNLFLTKFKLRVDDILLNAQEDGSFAGLNATQIKDKIQSVISPKETPAQPILFHERYESFTESRTAARTKEIYRTTLRRIAEYDSDYKSLQFSDIDKRWLAGFNAYLAKTSPSENARNIHFRNIRAVFNDAIDDEVTTSYPFRKFKIKNVPTVKRSLNIAQVRNLFACSPWRVYQEYLDIFKLMFYLCGINLIDLCNLTDNNVINDRIEYKRAKTGKIYSVRIEPEADEIIQRYKGTQYLLSIRDRYKNHKDYMKHINKGLSKIGNVIGKEKNGVPIMQPICPFLSTYWARHTWATIAAELDIPKETIAAGLGHNIGSPITSIYIDFNQKKVDEANRKIIDYVLYSK